jgi:hypothetical protein
MKKNLLILGIFVVVYLCFEGSKNKVFNSIEYTYWENLTSNEQDSVLLLPLIDKNVLLYYQNNFQLSEDNNLTLELLDSVTKWGSKTKILYFYIFNQICKHSDGYVSEILGNYCLIIILNDPDYVLNYFKKDKKTEMLYAMFLGSEFYFKTSAMSNIKYDYSEFKNILDKKIGIDNKSIKQEFCNLIEKAMIKME